jgi:hypothetical protein
MIFNIAGRLMFETSLDVETSRFPVLDWWDPVNTLGTELANGPYLCVVVADGKVVVRGKMVIER